MNDRQQKILAIALTAIFIGYVLYEMYSRYKENKRREELHALDVEHAKAHLKYHEALYEKTKEPQLKPTIEFRYPWEKRRAV